MSTYIVCSCYLENLDAKIYLTEVLLKFAQQNNLRVGIDTEKKLIDIYSKIAERKPEIASWLTLMSYKPTSFEEIVCISEGISEEIEMFLFVCKSVINKNCMIVNSIQKYSSYIFVDERKIQYKDKIICLLEKDDAVEEFKTNPSVVNITDSIVANEHSSIKGVNK